MTTVLWIVQGLLAAAFLGAGAGKLMKSPDELVEMGMDYADDFSGGQIKTIGALEVLGGVGVVVPAAVGVVPVLTGLAAVGLVLTMLGAIVTHVRRGEYPMIVVNLILGAMAGFVASQYLM